MISVFWFIPISVITVILSVLGACVGYSYGLDTLKKASLCAKRLINGGDIDAAFSVIDAASSIRNGEEHKTFNKRLELMLASITDEESK